MRILPGVKTLIGGLAARITAITEGADSTGPSEAVDLAILVNRAIEEASKYRDKLKAYLRDVAVKQGLGQGDRISVDVIGAIGSAQVTMSPRAPASLSDGVHGVVLGALGTTAFGEMYERRVTYAPVKDWRKRFERLPKEVQSALTEVPEGWAPPTSPSVKLSK